MNQRLLAISILILFSTGCAFPWNPQPPSSPVPLPPTPTPQPLVPTAPAALLPTFTPTAVPPATNTPNPALPDWTVMVYLDADNNLELAGLQDVNEMEAAGTSADVQVLVQIDRAAGETDADGDWSDARRFLIQGDKVVDAITSPVVEQLGEANMGDPDTLADFINWGMAAYPANQYALIIWDHGAGWNGAAFDGDDALTLPDLRQALTAVASEKLDVIAFDACLMGQLDVLTAVQPYADFAVASEALTPGQGWNYTDLLRRLYEQPDLDAAGLAEMMADAFTAAYPQDDFVTMTAVNLQRLPPLTYQLEQLAALLAADPVLTAGAVTDARSGAEAYARVYADQFERYAAVDLAHFAQILAQRSDDPAIQTTATAVLDALDTAVIANERGRGYAQGGGIAIYLPRTADFYNPAYAQAAELINWNQFLTRYHAAGLADLPRPEIALTANLRDEVNMQNPAYVEFEIAGREIETVAMLAGRFEEDGRLRLFEYDRLIPEPTILADGSQISEWRDGVHEDFFVWLPEVTYLVDSAGNGDFVVMWPGAPDSGEDAARLFTVQGRFRRAAAASDIAAAADVAANLAFDHRDGRLAGVWGWQSDESAAPAQILPQPGDLFTPFRIYREADGRLSREPGPELRFDASGQLAFAWRPVPDGEYLFGFTVENAAGGLTETFTTLTVTNSAAVPAEKAYFDPYLGFQFNYPADWYAPVYAGALLYTANLSNTTQLQITLYPDVNTAVTADTLTRQTIDQFGAVDVLYADDAAIAGQHGRRTAYGYTAADGEPRTGIFLAFVQGRTGFVLDVDGRQADEADTITAVNRIIASWQTAPVGFGLQPGDWAQADVGGFSLARPSDFVYQEVRGWQRFSRDQYTFVALRMRPATAPAADTLETLVRDAGAGAADFAAEAPFTFALGPQLWQRADFSYTAADGGEIWGFIMARMENGQEVVAWAEAPASDYNDLADSVFLVMIADMVVAE